MIVAACTRKWCWLSPTSILGGALSWSADIGIPRNKVATFGHPFSSPFNDLGIVQRPSPSRRDVCLRRTGLP